MLFSTIGLVISLPGAKKGPTDTINVNDGFNLVKFLTHVFKSEETTSNLEEDTSIGAYWIITGGFSYKLKSGFMIGMNGLGLELGYDFTKLLIRN